MNLPKLFLVSGLLIAIAAFLLVAQHLNQVRLQSEIESLRQQLAKLNDDNQSLSNNLAQTITPKNDQMLSDTQFNEFLKLRGENTVLQNAEKDETAIAAKAWLTKVNKLKQRLEETPNAKIPELQFVTDQDWLNVTSKRLETDADYRQALASLRSIAESKFAEMFQQASRKYSTANNGQEFTDLAQLQPYFDSPVDDAILQRWQLEPAKAETAFQVQGDWLITQKAPVDDVFDSRYVIGQQSTGVDGFLDTEQNGDILSSLRQAFSAANNGHNFTDLSQLLPYATTAEQSAILQKWILRGSASH